MRERTAEKDSRLMLVIGFVLGWFASNYLLVETRYEWSYRRAVRRETRREARVIPPEGTHDE
jgi:hypothetical protein